MVNGQDAARLMRLLPWWQRFRVKRRKVITSCDLTYLGYVKHLSGTCKLHGKGQP